MLERLKALPLTIILTILIWMYAEAQFTSAQDNIRISVRIVSPSPDLAVSVIDDLDPKRARSSINLLTSVGGSKAQVDRLYQSSLNSGMVDEELRNLSYAPTERELAEGVDSVKMLNGLRYFAARRLTVTSATPPVIRFKVEQVERVESAPATAPATRPN